MLGLAHHRTDPADPPEQPLKYFAALAQFGGEEALLLLREVDHGGAGLEDREWPANVGCFIDRRNPATSDRHLPASAGLAEGRLRRPFWEPYFAAFSAAF